MLFNFQSRPSESYWNSLNAEEKIRSLTECYVVANKMNRVDDEFKENVRTTFQRMEHDLIKCVSFICMSLRLHASAY